jgi:amidohydrolase
MSGKQNTLRAVKNNFPIAKKLKQLLYDNPELPCQEKIASKAIVDILKEAKFNVEYPFMEKELGYDTAFRATFRNGNGPTVAFLTEYDALPLVGHGCGHNYHGPLSILAALAMKDLHNDFSGTIEVIGTPAEEEAGAKAPMARAEIFDHLDLACMVHTWSGKESMAQMDVLALKCSIFDFYGQKTHAAASPWEGRSALAAARKCLDLIDARRECFTPDLRCNGVFMDGGNLPSIIPEHASVKIEYRSDSLAKLNKLHEAVLKCAKGASIALDCTFKVKPAFDDFADMVRIPSLEDELAKDLTEYGFTMGKIRGATGSSDVGNVSYHCPAIQGLLAITDKDIPLHTVELREATMTEQANDRMQKGAAALVTLAMRIMKDADFRKEVKAGFRAALKEKQK